MRTGRGVKISMSGSSLKWTASSHQSIRDAREKRFPVGRCRGGKSLEVVGEANVREEAAVMFVEMKEGTRAAVERAARFLLHAVEAPQFLEQWFETVEILGPRVSHAGIEAGAGRNGKSTTLALTLCKAGLSMLGG